jgi:hypothetical protein
VLIDRLQLFARFETYGFAWWDAHLGASARIAADAGLARTDIEDSETPQFDSIALRQSLFHALEDGFHSHFSFGLGNARLVHDFVDDVEFDHNRLRRKFVAQAIEGRC